MREVKGRSYHRNRRLVAGHACQALAAGRTTGILRQLQLATLERESVAARLERIRDYLNWFEAVAAPRNDYGAQTSYAPPPVAEPAPVPEQSEDPNAPKRKGWWQRLTE